MTPAQREAVRQRAGGRCEYCRLPDSALDPPDFHVEHIVARKHSGSDDEDNLAWSCIFCNLYKGPNLTSLDPDTGDLTRLFNPRRDRWEDHFRFEDASITSITAFGRTTCWLLELNAEILRTLRMNLMREQQW